MRPSYCAVVLCLLSVGMGQNPSNAVSSHQTPLHGIKIISSTFDSTASPQRVQLDFIDDSPADITAWAYCVRAEKANNADPNQGGCQFKDLLPVVVDREVQERITREESPADCTDCHFIHPGQHQIFSSAFALPVRSAQIQVILVAYSNGKVETSGETASLMLQQLSGGRENLLRSTQLTIEVGRRILADVSNPHPAASLISELQQREQNDPAIASHLREFKRPERRKGNNKEFVPADERTYLGGYLSEQEMKAAEFRKHQVQGVNQ